MGIYYIRVHVYIYTAYNKLWTFKIIHYEISMIARTLYTTICLYWSFIYRKHAPEIYYNKWMLEFISSFSRPGLVKLNKIYIEKVN